MTLKTLHGVLEGTEELFCHILKCPFFKLPLACVFVYTSVEALFDFLIPPD